MSRSIKQMHTKSKPANLKEKDSLENRGVDGSIILNVSKRNKV
jgi:hypothetical protein